MHLPQTSLVSLSLDQYHHTGLDPSCVLRVTICERCAHNRCLVTPPGGAVEQI